MSNADVTEAPGLVGDFLLLANGNPHRDSGEALHIDGQRVTLETRLGQAVVEPGPDDLWVNRLSMDYFVGLLVRAIEERELAPQDLAADWNKQHELCKLSYGLPLAAPLCHHQPIVELAAKLWLATPELLPEAWPRVAGLIFAPE